MARTSDPHAATVKAWETRARSAGGGGVVQQGGDWAESRPAHPAFDLVKTRAGDGYAFKIMVGRKRVGHLSGFEVGDSFHLYKTELSDEGLRGTGLYRKAAQQVADQYPGGMWVHEWEASRALKLSLAKMDTYEKVDDRLYVRPRG